MDGGNDLSYEALLDGCDRANALALSELSCLACAHPLAWRLLQDSLTGNAAARKVLLLLPRDCALRIEWNRLRQDTVARWFGKHSRHRVEPVFRVRLRCFPDEVADAVQEFWMWFLMTGQELMYDPMLGSEETFIRHRALFRAMEDLRNLCIRASRVSDGITATDMENKVSAPLKPANDASDGWFERRLHRLILTNAIEPHEAVVLLARECAGFTTSDLMAQYLNSTLSQLCESIPAVPGASGSQLILDTVSLLRSQLSLPPENPIGSRTLQELLSNRAALDRDRRIHSARSSAAVLQYWIDQARRVCMSGLERAGGEQMSDSVMRIELRAMRDLRDRLDFLIVLLNEGGQSERALVWAWQKILDFEPSQYRGLKIGDAAATFERRVRWMLPDYGLPEDFATRLAGGRAGETVGAVLGRSGLEPNRIERGIEEKFRRFRGPKEPRQ